MGLCLQGGEAGGGTAVGDMKKESETFKAQSVSEKFISS